MIALKKFNRWKMEISNRHTAEKINKSKKNTLSTTYCLLSSEQGIALVMVLILSAIVLAIITGLIYMITSTTQISGMQKRYRTALEAGMGGADVTFRLLALRGEPDQDTKDAMSNANDEGYNRTISVACFNAKLNSPTSATNWAACGSYTNATAMVIDPADPTTYDFRFGLGKSPYPAYRAYAKIVDTVEGNSGGDEGLLKHGVVSSGSGEITVVSIPYLYTIEVDAENSTNPSERAKLSILYQY
jgi:hypothetical protein